MLIGAVYYYSVGSNGLIVVGLIAVIGIVAIGYLVYSILSEQGRNGTKFHFVVGVAAALAAAALWILAFKPDPHQSHVSLGEARRYFAIAYGAKTECVGRELDVIGSEIENESADQVWGFVACRVTDISPVETRRTGIRIGDELTYGVPSVNF